MEVNHGENLLWDSSSPYPKVGYQVFYRMDITKLHPFAAGFESSGRVFIQPNEAADYHKGWHSVLDEIIKEAKVVR